MKKHAVTLAWLSLTGIALIWGAVALLGDRVWWTVPLLYGPRWIWGAALLGALPAVISSPRRGWIPALLIGVMLLFGLMDFRLGIRRLFRAGGATVRVMELNADSDRSNPDSTLALIGRYSPDVVVIAECGPALKAALAKLPGFQLRTAITSLCLVSRGAILEWIERDPTKDIWKEGGAGAIVRAVVSTGRGPLRVGLVHLETPRDALQNFVDKSEILKQGPATRQNMAQRERESSLAAAWIDQGAPMPLVIAGDFNLPVESAIYRRHWGKFHNAFGEVGFGTGYTKHTRRWGTRIDHILSGEDVVAVWCQLGSNVGSDHLPLIADLRLPKFSGPAAPGNQ